MFLGCSLGEGTYWCVSQSNVINGTLMYQHQRKWWDCVLVIFLTMGLKIWIKQSIKGGLGKKSKR